MSAKTGRLFKIKKNNVTLLGVKSKSMTRNNEPVDVTTDDENGFRTVMAEPGTYSFEMSVDIVVKDAVLRDLAMATGSAMLTDITLEFENGDTCACSLFLTNYEQSGATNGAVEASASLQSSGPWVYTKA
jgi:predicted secreted protein